jgi:hypothetical protein
MHISCEGTKHEERHEERISAERAHGVVGYPLKGLGDRGGLLEVALDERRSEEEEGGDE